MNDNKDIFYKLKDQLSIIDPVKFAETYLTLEGEPFRLSGNGFKPFSDIFRYIGIKALEPDSKPVILVKGRQVGGTIMACALEMYFMGSGLFGTDSKPPIRIIHAYPLLEHAGAYSKTKLNQMISGSIRPEGSDKKGKVKSFMQNILDPTTPANDSLTFKQFIGGNHIWIESVGLDADRIMGRMLSLEIELPTPTGFIKLKDLKEGDQLFDENGNICNVIKLHPIDLKPDSYRITFDDGITIDACADHKWLTYSRNERMSLNRFNRGILKTNVSPKIKTTKEIFNTLTYLNKTNHSIPNCLPLNYPEQDLLLDPYLFGLLLNNGSQKGTTESTDPEIFKQLYNKHIPENYMRSSFVQRLALLQGLMDTDGHCDKNGNIEFVQVRKELAYQVYELVLSLGIKAYIYKRHNDKYRIRFITNLPVFRIKRKLSRIKNKITTKSSHRFITNIEKIDSVPMRCITVDSQSSLFLVTKHCIPTHNSADIIFFDETQKMSALAIGNALKIMTSSKYGKPGKGVQVFFGTPRKKGSDFYKMWSSSSQQYYYLGCEHCKKHFPLYTPSSNDWEKIWIYGFIVKCPHCGHEQNKLEAADRGKWMALKDYRDDDCKLIGFHINQLYFPTFKREDIDNERPGIHPINTERVFQTEVLGEFFQGDTSPITPEQIAELCSDKDRKFTARISPGERQLVVLGIDYGLRADLEQLANPENTKISGQSYSTAVVLSAQGGGLLSIEFCTKFKRNDSASKKGIIDQIMRQYSIQLAIGDIGFSQDFSSDLHMTYGDRYLVSRAHAKVNNYIKYRSEIIPKEILFERDYYIQELYEVMKKGQIKFPFGDYEKCAWLIDHCTSMEIKPSISRTGADPIIHYVKGSTPNDGFCALLNAYLAYKFLITKGFTVTNLLSIQENLTQKNKPLALAAYIPRRF